MLENDTHFSKITDFYFDSVGSDSYLVRGDSTVPADKDGICEEIKKAIENINNFSEEQDFVVPESKTDLAHINANLHSILMSLSGDNCTPWPAHKEGVNF